MSPRWKIWVGLAIGAVVCAFLVVRWTDSAQTALEETRRELHQQGFKTDLSEFNFTTSAEMRARASALTATDPARSFAGGTPRGMGTQLMTAVGSNSAVVFWRDGRWDLYTGEDLWPQWRETMTEHQAALDAACEAALSGPIRFDLTASAGGRMLLPHLAVLRNLTEELAGRALLDLRDGNKDAAWTNLLALTALVTSWDPEPAGTSHLFRDACVTLACNAAWQVLQAGGWRDDQLAELQRAWESADFFKGLPETAAFEWASAAEACQQERRHTGTGPAVARVAPLAPEGLGRLDVLLAPAPVPPPRKLRGRTDPPAVLSGPRTATARRHPMPGLVGNAPASGGDRRRSRPVK